MSRNFVKAWHWLRTQYKSLQCGAHCTLRCYVNILLLLYLLLLFNIISFRTILGTIGDKTSKQTSIQTSKNKYITLQKVQWRREGRQFHLHLKTKDIFVLTIFIRQYNLGYCYCLTTYSYSEDMAVIGGGCVDECGGLSQPSSLLAHYNAYLLTYLLTYLTYQ